MNTRPQNPTPPAPTAARPTRLPEQDGCTDASLLIEAHGISVQAGGRALLDGVDIAVRAGEIVTLIGPNGAGKTTLIRALLGTLDFSAGFVYRAPGLRVGYLPQRLQVDPVMPFTVRRFLTLARPRSLAVMRLALEEVGVAHLERAQLSQLSGGEFQRVLMARTLVREPTLLILDEPVQGVDVVGQRELYGLIVQIRRNRGCGVLLISHDLHLVMSATDRVVCINQCVCCAGEPDTVLRHPAYLELFGPHAGQEPASYTHACEPAYPGTHDGPRVSGYEPTA